MNVLGTCVILFLSLGCLNAGGIIDCSSGGRTCRPFFTLKGFLCDCVFPKIFKDNECVIGKFPLITNTGSYIKDIYQLYGNWVEFSFHKNLQRKLTAKFIKLVWLHCYITTQQTVRDNKHLVLLMNNFSKKHRFNQNNLLLMLILIMYYPLNE